MNPLFSFLELKKLRKKEAPLFFLVGCGAALTFFFLFAGSLYKAPFLMLPPSLPPVDVIVCLMGGRGRIAAAEQLWLEYEASFPENPPFFYLSGLDARVNESVFTQQLQRYTREKLSAEKLILENQSTNTSGNAEWFVQAVLKHPEWRKGVLVTSLYHQKRAKLIFERALAQKNLHPQWTLYDYPVTIYPYSAASWKKDLLGIQVTFSEYMKWLYYRLRFG